MKKLSRNLRLRRETILTLDRRSLEAIRGGDDSGTTKIKKTNSCNSICQCNA